MVFILIFSYLAKTGKLQKQVSGFKAFKRRIGSKIFRPEAAVILGCSILIY